MKLKEFIKELESISKNIDNPSKVEVGMADCVPVVKPIFKEGTVFITDIDPEMKNSSNRDRAIKKGYNQARYVHHS